jgi:hypothetical protein
VGFNIVAEAALYQAVASDSVAKVLKKSDNLCPEDEDRR